MNSGKNERKVFYGGLSRSAGRFGDFFVTRLDNCWHLNAGVNCYGHDPGFGVWYDVLCNSKEYRDFNRFLQKTVKVQQFIMEELGADRQTCDKIFREIWEYIH